MRTQPFQPSETMVKNSPIARSSILPDSPGSAGQQRDSQSMNSQHDHISFSIAESLKPEVLLNISSAINHRDKNSFMKTFISKPGVFAIALLIANLFFVNNVAGQISLQNAWAQQYAAIAYPVSATPVNASYVIANGTNRILVVAVATTSLTAGAITCSVTYGGQALTSASGDGTLTATPNHTFLFYLLDAQIGSAAAGKSLNVNCSGGTAYFTVVTTAVYAGVNQTTPTTDAKNFNSTASSTSVGPINLNINANDQAISVINLARSTTGSNTLRTISTFAANWASSGLEPSSNTNTSGFLFQGYIGIRTVPSTNITSEAATHTASNTGTFKSYTAMSLKAAPAASITTGSITGSPFCVTASIGASVSVPFTSVGTYTSNTYTAQLSNAAGSFASPTTIGTLVSNGNTGPITATIPANTATGAGYRIRVISSSPAVTGTDNGTNLSINLSTNSITPTATQNIGVNANGAALSVTESPAASSRQWFVGTTSGGPYTIPTGVTATSYIPMFGVQGNYYVVCISTFACGNVTSNEVLINVSPTIATNTIIGSPFCVTSSVSAPVSVPFTSVGTFSGNTYTAQLSNASGSFASPVNIGTLVSDANSGTINATIPANTASGTGYRIRVVSTNPASVVTPNTSDLTINLATSTIAPVAVQNIAAGVDGTQLTVTESPVASSRQWFYSTVSGGPYNTATGITTATFTPNFSAQGSFYVVCISTFACGTATSNEVQVNVLPTITTLAITGSPFCITPTNGAPVSVSFTSLGTFSGNTYTAQLSNAVGSFAAPTNIGTLVSDGNSGTIDATIPPNTAGFGGYRIRVISNSPQALTTDNGSNLTITLSNNSVAPGATQNIAAGSNGTQLTVTETPAANSREWFYSTVSGGPYSTTTGVTSTSFTPNFAAQGTYYVVCVSTFNCGTATSNQVQVNVSATVTTGTITGSPFCAGASVNVPFTSTGVFSGNTYTAQLSDASGSFASPVNIGTLTVDDNSGVINATIPAGASAGTGYLIRVIASSPATTGSSSSAITINVVPVANFVANATSITTGGVITFTDQSTSIPTSWSWSFSGGTPAISTDQNPSVTYNTGGTFSVTLTATNACGNNVFTRTNYITVTALTMPVTFNSGGSIIIPPGVTCIQVEAWGGGGKGGQKGTPDGAAGGGGGGAYARSILPVTPSQSYDVFVGAGSTTTSAGADSRFRLQPAGPDLVRATGGNSVANDATPGATGGSASTSVGDFKFNGGQGGNVSGSNGGGGGSSGGTSSNGAYTASTNTSTGGSVIGGGSGGAGSTTDDVAGSPGIVPGGGGGGARRNNGTISGGNGATGRVTISWVDASDFHISATSCVASASTVTVTSNTLANGNYTITYSTTNPATTGNTATMNFNAGSHTGSFSTIALTGPVSDITVTGITFTGWTCSSPVTSNNTASIHVLPTAVISYAGTPFCVTDAQVKDVTQTGQGGGTYSSTAGLSIDGSTGAITPSSSTAGTYVVTYTFSDGFCPNTTTTSVTIGTPPVATFSYLAGSYCQALPSNPSPPANPLPAFSGGGVAGTFTALPSGLVFVNTATGQVNLATSAPGTYTVTNTVTLNGCTTTFDSPISITALPTATISYGTTTFCTTSAPQKVTRTTPSFALGSYSVTPAGLTIDGSNDLGNPDADAGKITPSTSLPGTYLVTYTFTDGICSNTTTTTVVISAPVNLAVAAQSPVVCTGSGTNITVALSDAAATYQLRNNADNSLIGGPVTGTGGTINLPTGPLTIATTFNVLATVTATGCTGQMSATPTVTIAEQPTATAGGSQTICANGSATVSGASSTNGTILWTHNGAGSLSNATTLTPTYTAAPADGGNTVTLTMTVSNSPCTAATATYTLFVNPIPTVNISTSSICIGSTTTILSPVSGGVWVSNSPSVATVTNDGTVTGVTAGSVTFTFTSAAGCSNTTSTLTIDGTCQVVTLSQPTQLTATISGDSPAPICAGQSANITVTISGGTAPYKVIYNSIEYTGSGSTIIFPVSPTTTTVYNSSNVTVTGAHNCTSSTTGSATITVTPLSSIVLQDGPASQAICIGNAITTVDYVVGGSGTGASITSGSLPLGVNGSFNAGIFSISGTPTESGTFNYTITAAGPCITSISGSITVNALPTVNFSGLAGSYCIDGSSVTLTGNHSPSGTFIGDGITDNGNGTATFSPLAAGVGTHINITYIYTDGNGCSNSQAQTVTVNSLPIVTCPANSTVCLSAGAFTLSGASPAGGTYSGNGVSGDTFDPAIAGVGDHAIIYSYTDGNGCSNSCTFTITVVQLVVSIDNTPEAHCGASQPAALTANASGGITFGDPQYFYQWQVYSTEFSTYIDISTASEPSAGTDTYQPPMLNTPGTYVYRVHVFDQCGDVYSSAKTIIINALPVISDVVKTSHNGSDLSCTNSTDGEITVTASGAAPLLYSDNNGTTYQAGNVFSGLAAGTYLVVVKDNNGCISVPESVTIVAPGTLTVGSSLKTDVSCHGGNDGSISLGTVSGGTPAYVYTWTKTGDATFSVTGTTANLSGLTAGTYNYSVTDANNCSVVTGSVTIMQPEISTIQTNVDCNGNHTGSATVSITGAAGPFTYLWDDASAQTTATATNLAAGTYHVTVFYAPGCATTTQVTITQPDALSAVIASQVNINCNGGNSGSATVSVTGGTGPYSYLWDDASAQTTATASNLAAGTYQVTVTDANGCQATAQVTITQSEALVLGPSDKIDVSCFNGSNGSVIAGTITNAVGTVTYSWKDVSNTEVGTTSTVNGLPAGTYTLTITDNCFTRTNSITIGYADNSAPVISNCPSSDITFSTDAGVCNYTAKNGELNVQATDDCPLTYTYLLSGAISGNGSNSLDGVVFEKGTTQVIWIVSDGLHNSTCIFNVVVNDNEAPVITCPGNKTINCQDSYNPNANVSLGIATATDNCTSIANILISSSDVSTQNPDASTAGHYNYTITRTWKATDEAGKFSTCAQTITVQDITAPTNIVVPADVTVSCAAAVPVANDGAITATDNCSESLTVTHQDVITNQSCINRYTIERTYTVSDASGNSSSKTQTITVFDDTAPVISSCPASTAFCQSANGNYTVPALVASDNCGAAIVTYHITGATERDGTGSDASGIFGIGISTIEWTVKDACNNTSTCSTIITIYPTPPTPVVTVTNTCGSSTLSTTAGGSLSWSTGASGSIITVNTPGTYTVVSTINGCPSAAGSGVAAPILVPPAPVITVTNNCDGSVTLSTTAPGNLLWSNFSTGPSITVFSGGTYSVTQSNSCYTSPPGSAVANPVITLNAPTISISQPTCSVPTGSILITAPTAVGMTYSIDGVHYQSSTTFSTLVPDIYNVTVKNATGCISMQTVALINTQPGTPPVPVVTVDNHCNGTSTLSTTATGNLSWSTGASGQSITVNNGGSYSVTQSVNGCTSLPGFGTAAPNNTPISPSVTIVQPTCSVAGGTITIAAPTGTGLTYSKDGINYQSSITFSGLAPNDYNITVRNAGGCISTATLVTINAQPAAPATPVVTVENTCAGVSILSTTATGNLAWSTGSAGPSITVSIGGTYSVTQTVNGCASLPGFGTATPNNTPIAPAVMVVQPTCSVARGSIIITAPTGAGFTYSIDGNSYQSGITFSGLTPNTYNVTVRNGGGCLSTATAVVINSQPAIPATPVVTVQNNCDGTSILSTTANGTLQWSTGSSGPSITVNTGGLFSVTQSVNGCTSLPGFGLAAPLTTPPAPTLSITQPNCSTALGTITLTAPIGTGLYYSIDGIAYQSSTVFSGLVANTYNIRVKNANECVSAPTSAVINTQPTTPAAPTVGTITQPTFVTPTGSVVLSGLPAGNWTINPGAISGSTGSRTVSGLAPGATYNFTVTNAAGCTSPASADVVIDAAPTAPPAPIVGTITQPTCATPTGSVVLNGLPAAGIWTLTRTPGSVISTGAGTSTTIPGLAPGIYTYTVTDAIGYTSLASANIVINAAPPIPAAPTVGTINQPTCAVSTGSVVLNGLPAAGTWTLTRSPGGTTSTGTGTSSTIGSLASGTYTYTVTNAAGCTSLPSANVVINVQPTAPTVAAITGTVTVCAGSTTQLSDATAGGTWSVTNGTGTASISTGGLMTGITAGTVTAGYTVTNSCGTATATTTVTVANGLSTASISYGGPIIANQLTALPFNEGTGIAAADISGNNHNGTLTGATWVAGKYGQAVSFNGTSNFVSVADHADFTLNPAQNYTWSAWVNNNNFNEWGTVWSQTIDVNNYFYFYAHTSTDAEAGPVTNGISVYWYNGANKVVLHSNNNVLTAGTWSHIAVTYNGSLTQANRFTIYVNGVDVTNRTDVVSAGTLGTLNPTNIRMGSNQPWGDFLNAAIDEMRFYNRLLTSAEIQTDMITPIAPANGNASFCQTGTATVTQTGQAGGVYSSSAGLSINGTTGAINLAASTAGTYTVTYSYSNGSCQGTATASLTIVSSIASISYAGSPYCQTGTATVTQTGQANGTYSSTAGLSINGTTGAINLAASTAGTYTVTYSFSNGTCSGTTTTSVTIVAIPIAGISYTGSPYCQTGTATVTQTGQAGGAYSSTAGLSINPSTGAINLAASTTGTYTVTYSLSNGNCLSAASTSVTIVAIPTASISYTGSPYCQTGTATVTQTGQANGTYTSTAGLSINGTTGAINLAASTAGTYTVTYSFSNGTCSGTTATSVTIVAIPATSISYAASPYCSIGTATVTQTGQANGTYSSTAGLSINGTTGAINLAASTLGTYTVTYSFSNGTCSGTATTSVTIVAPPTASISYPGGPFCQTGTATVTRTGQANGTYSSTAGLNINGTTGAINLAASTAGTYTVTYSFTNGSCGGATTTSVTIIAPPTASISYAGGPFCQTGSATVTQSGQTGGTYSSTPGLSITPSTGAINLAASTAGTYTVTYNFSNGTCPGTATTSVTINALPAASISYAGPNTTNQLVALPMNEGTGTTAADISGHSHSGTLTNAPTWTTGKYGQGVSFNGTTNYINIADHADFTLSPTQSYTWSSWVRNTNFNQWQTVWSQTIDVNNYFYFYAHTSTDADAGPVTNGVSVFWTNGANKLVIHSNNNVLTAGVWSHITVTYNGTLAQASRFTIYVNGVDVTNRTDVASAGTIAALNPTNIRIGSNQAFGEFLNGAVDEVRFYNRLLTTTEVQTDMNTPIAPATGGSFCQSGTATVTQTGQAGGTYSSTPGLSINAATGAINLAASTPGTYIVTYSFSNGTCPGTATTSVTIVNCTLTRVQTGVVNPEVQQSLAKMEITVYPNPTVSFFNLKVKSQNKETVEIRVFDMLGKIVQQQRGAPEQIFRLGEHIASGIYVVEVRQAGQIATTKVIKKGDEVLISN